MFSSSKKTEGYENPDKAREAGATVIARGVRVEGDFTSQGDVVIEGEVNGRIETGGLLSVGPEAKLKAEVVAGDAIVAGVVEGTLAVKNRLELKASARVQGDTSCQTVVVEAGALLNGKISMGAVKAELPHHKSKAAQTEEEAAA
jgi:cytoskeletal protein CcmA (bactofilin family)